jgi:hypothetical protein
MIGLRRKNGITDALLQLTSNAAFIVRDDSYEGIEWLSPEIPMPSKAEVENKISELEANEPMRCLREIRNWYLKESDWSQGLDVRAIKGPEWCKAWDNYREQLRNLTKTAKPYFADEMDFSVRGVEWPVLPSE